MCLRSSIIHLVLGHCRARNYWVSEYPGHAKMVKETEFLDQGLRLETQVLPGQHTTLNLGFLTGNPEISREIQILRQVFRTETKNLIIISSPALAPFSFLLCHLRSTKGAVIIFVKV